tara:strand:- start:19312 stop:19503 length:192 start_codon:yes stop_codon:yes gene_type:complete
MKETIRKTTTKNNTTITLYNYNKNRFLLEVVDVEGNDLDKYDFYFNNKVCAVSEYNQAVTDNS